MVNREKLSKRKIASIRRDIAILVHERGINLNEARHQMNQKYGNDWRERGLISNSDNQWTEEELNDIPMFDVYD